MYGTPPAADIEASVLIDAEGRRWLRCGDRFDVLRVPEPAGRWALRRLIGYRQPALRPGPVALDPEPHRITGTGDADAGTGTGGERTGGSEPGERQGAACLFFVAPGAKEDLPELLEWLDWGGIDLGLRAFGEGERIPEPDVWLHDREAAAPEVVALLATIAECCSRRMLRQAVPAPRPERRS